jgi:myo-inositol 2-dehydrogenase/D-chiro-inositol 1-dehydrogenase
MPRMDNTSRRRFLQTAGALGAFTIVQPRLVRGAQANSAVRVGLLGCGRRGSADASNIVENTGARLVALADLYQDQLDRGKQRFDKLAASKGYAGIARTFVGPDSCEQMMASKEVDAVVIATPAYFHPDHLAAAVAAGKHVYQEKPVAVDVAGAMRVLEIGKKAEGRLSLDVGFQIRSAPPFVELVRRIHAGALGDIASGEAHYFAPFPDQRQVPGASVAERRIRNWIEDRVLSGDIIVEQNIHALDICNWVMNAHPLKAFGHGSHNGRSGAPAFPEDDCYSHFNVVFVYPNDVHVSFSSVQFGKTPFDVSERFFGTRGESQSPYSGPLGIQGDEPWTWEGSDKPGQATFSASGSFSDNLAQADPEKQKGFIGSIASGQFHNQAAGGVEAALTAILGRQAAYAGREIAWDEMLRSNERWDSGIDIHRI